MIIICYNVQVWGSKLLNSYRGFSEKKKKNPWVANIGSYYYLLRDQGTTQHYTNIKNTPGTGKKMLYVTKY